LIGTGIPPHSDEVSERKILNWYHSKRGENAEGNLGGLLAGDDAVCAADNGDR